MWAARTPTAGRAGRAHAVAMLPTPARALMPQEAADKDMHGARLPYTVTCMGSEQARVACPSTTSRSQ